MNTAKELIKELPLTINDVARLVLEMAEGLTRAEMMGVMRRVVAEGVRAVKAAGACRHTFATYHARYFRNIAAQQLEMGHSTQRLLHSRYVSPIPHVAAKRFRHSAL